MNTPKYTTCASVGTHDAAVTLLLYDVCLCGSGLGIERGLRSACKCVACLGALPPECQSTCRLTSSRRDMEFSPPSRRERLHRLVNLCLVVYVLHTCAGKPRQEPAWTSLFYSYRGIRRHLHTGTACRDSSLCLDTSVVRIGQVAGFLPLLPSILRFCV